MSKEGMFKILAVILAFALFGGVYIYSKKVDAVRDEFVQNRVSAYNEQLRQEEALEQNDAKKTEEFLQRFSGVVCWGSDFTVGKGASANMNYPSVLKKKFEEQGYNIPVVNLGIKNESSLTVLGRSGAIPIVTDEFVVNKKIGEISEIKLSSKWGGEVRPLRYSNNPDFNPCLIGGVQGYIGGVVDGDNVNYIFQRITSGDEITIPAGTEVVTTSSTKYKDYFQVICLGENGGWNGKHSELVKQLQAFDDYYEGQCLIVGYLNGDDQTNNVLDTLMADAFGDRFLNARKAICKKNNPDEPDFTEDSLSGSAVEVTGAIPESLKPDEHSFTDEGYSLLAEVIFEKLTTNLNLK